MKEEENNSASELKYSFKKFIHDIFDLTSDTDKLATIEDVREGIYVKGQTTWVLIFSILIASTGLNISSSAVVIGAMLISPLMGPILGIGLSLGINDVDFLKKSIKNFGVMIVLSIVTSFLFFSIPSFQNETPEIISRTYPDVRDVIIALSGGLALIIAFSRRNKSLNTIAGVAIATALMPPLCTAGYGLATGKWNFFGGAMFLFSINTIFIATATFTVVRFLKFPYETYTDSAERKKISRFISIIAISILIPSIYMFYQLFKKSDFEQKVDALIEDIRGSKGIVILDVEKNYNKRTVSFAVIGKSIDDKDINSYKENMEKAGYKNVKFSVMQDVANLEAISKIEAIENSYLSTQELLTKKEQELLEKEKVIFELKTKLIIKKSDQIPFQQMANEIKIIYENIEEVAFSNLIKTNFTTTDTIPMVYVKWKSSTNKKIIPKDMEKIELWLQTKLESKKLKVTQLN